MMEIKPGGQTLQYQGLDVSQQQISAVNFGFDILLRRRTKLVRKHTAPL